MKFKSFFDTKIGMRSKGEHAGPAPTAEAEEAPKSAKVKPEKKPEHKPNPKVTKG